MTKEAYNESIIQSGMSATFDVLNRPKNLAKPEMGDDIGQLYFLAEIEMRKLHAEIYDKSEIDFTAVRAEAGDVIAYLCGLVYECDRRLKDAP